MLNKPCYYVFGNHGREIEYQDKGGQWLEATEPQGAINLHCRTAKEGPLLLAGLEGSIRYNNSSDHQFTNFQMWLNVLLARAQAAAQPAALWPLPGRAGHAFAAARHP